MSTVGGVVTVTVRVRNLGPLPADGAVVREIPQVDPRHPDQVAQILGVTPTIRATSPCTSTRPLRCGAATLAVGAEAVVRVRARMLRAGAYQSVAVVSSLTPDTNTTNNAAVSGLVVTRPSRVAVAVTRRRLRAWASPCPTASSLGARAATAPCRCASATARRRACS